MQILLIVSFFAIISIVMGDGVTSTPTTTTTVKTMPLFQIQIEEYWKVPKNNKHPKVCSEQKFAFAKAARDFILDDNYIQKMEEEVNKLKHSCLSG